MVSVKTVCHPKLDLIAVEVRSALIQSEQIRVVIEFPYIHDLNVKNKPALDWSNSNRHSTIMEIRTPHRADIKRVVDSTEYYVCVEWEGLCEFQKKQKHQYRLIPAKKEQVLKFSVAFNNSPFGKVLPQTEKTSQASVEMWKQYWTSGGVIDFNGSTDLRAFELERRIILSQYLVRTQSCGTIPPQESGLTHNSWYGKHHTEMIWWHTAHFALWNHPELLEKNLQWYISDLPKAQQTAKERGLDGARWSKMVGPDGRESPGNNPFIIWNQPHPIYLAELLYRLKSDRETLEKWKDLVLETTACMASMVIWDSTMNRYVLGPPLWHAQETYDPLMSFNPTFELAYWAYGLEVAQKWLKRLGLDSNEKWNHIMYNLSQLPVKDGLYVGLESVPTTFTEPENEIDHPSMLMALGFLPGTKVDTTIMRRTLHRVVATWRWEDKIWGWDYPMIAMTAARLGEPELAIDILLRNNPHNFYVRNGNCAQTNDLPVYLPANGALLSAIALMTAGWDGACKETPGFPKDGKWKIKYENINRLP
jgi:hypothetical protein